MFIHIYVYFYIREARSPTCYNRAPWGLIEHMDPITPVIPQVDPTTAPLYHRPVAIILTTELDLCEDRRKASK